MGLFERLNLAQEVVELRLGRDRATNRGAIACDLLLDRLIAVEALLHANAALETHDLVTAWYKHHATHLLVA